jgi:SNF2 family DNA or RNA helicase
VLLDEAHVIKSPKVQQSQACLALTSSRRWAVTGTPIGLDAADLFGLFVFLKLSPLDKSAYFDAYVKRVFTNTGNHYGGTPLPLLYCLSRCMIRHTKAQQLGGAPVLALPPKTEVEVPVDFSPEERAAYDKAHKAAKEQFGKASRCAC